MNHKFRLGDTVINTDNGKKGFVDWNSEVYRNLINRINPSTKSSTRTDESKHILSRIVLIEKNKPYRCLNHRLYYTENEYGNFFIYEKKVI